MASILLSLEELAGLERLPDQDFRMYVLMRSWVDFKTGIVGGPRGATVSYRRFREHMEVTPERGSTAAPVRRTDDALRASVARLERAGLIARVLLTGDSGFKFCYRLKLALLRPFEEPRLNPAKEPRLNPAKEYEVKHGVNGGPECEEARDSAQNEPQPSEYQDIDIYRASAREGELAAIANELGVSDGAVAKWQEDGITAVDLRVAVARCREYIQPPRRISSSYLAQVLETVLEAKRAPLARPSNKSGGRPGGRPTKPANRPANRWKKVAPDGAFDGVPPVSGNVPPDAGGGDDWIE